MDADDSWGIIIVVVGVLILFGAFLLAPWVELKLYGVPGSDITIYRVVCSNNASSMSDCSNPQALGRIAYKINANNRTVVEWEPDDTPAGTLVTYQTYTDCSIVDVGNWSCAYPEGGNFGFNSGHFFRIDWETVGEYFLYVSGSQWQSVRKPEVSTTPPLSGDVSPETTTSVTSTLPTQVGACDKTAAAGIGYRVEGNPNSGSAIQYTDGGTQVSYDTIQGVVDSQVGDQVKLCLVSIPMNCPPGDNRGRVYQATNLRTGESWAAQDYSHSCGGA